LDLSRPILPAAALDLSPGELAVLLAAATTAQDATATAHAQAILDAPRPVADRFAPITGSFDAAVAAALWRWRRDDPREEAG